jgi:hypothetical protein
MLPTVDLMLWWCDAENVCFGPLQNSMITSREEMDQKVGLVEY